MGGSPFAGANIKEVPEVSLKRLLVDFTTVFAATLVVSIVVTLLRNLIVHGASTIDWDKSLGLAVLFGIIFTWIGTRRRRKKPSAG